MQLNKLKAFAQKLRQDLSAQIRVRLELALADNSEFARSNPQGYKTFKELVESKGKDFVVEQSAYFWFNRLCALRFMDVRGYTPCGVVSPLPDTLEPELLYEARTEGFINEELVEDSSVRSQVAGLLSGEVLSDDPQTDAYRLLLNSACNSMHKIMPFLFQQASDYTEYLLPTDLLSSDSILARIRENMAEEDCESVEIIGWLYQYYISEKKDEIFADFKKNIKATTENIGPATQLFTPEWIVRYLVENSLGRLWMLNHPESSLIDVMEYYIKPDQEEHDFIKISIPEELKICDPCCGSGHMLVYAFELLAKIYEENGYSKADIPALILKHNLTGIEIDERAGELAAFVLVMKARELDRKFFRHLVKPNI